MSWVEDVLGEWGTWFRTQGAGQGWGGSVDMDRLFQSCGFRDPGVHSDPVFSEVLATQRDGQGPHQRINRYILQCGPDVRMVAKLRYAGILERVSEAGPKVRSKWVVSATESLEGCGRFNMEFGHWEHWAESGALPVVAVAGLMECDESRVFGLLGALHKRIRAELLQDATTRKNASTRTRRYGT